MEVSKDLSIRNETYTTNKVHKSVWMYHGFLSSPWHFSTDLSYRHSLAVGVSVGDLMAPCSSLTLKAAPERACSTLQGCVHSHTITFPISAMASNPACQVRHTQVPHTTSHHQAFSKSTPSCTPVSAITVSKTGQLTVRTACWMRS